MSFFCSRDNASCARGMGSEDRTKTPSMLHSVSQILRPQIDQVILECKCNIRLRIPVLRLQVPPVGEMSSNSTKSAYALDETRSGSMQAHDHRRSHRKQDLEIDTT